MMTQGFDSVKILQAGGYLLIIIALILILFKWLVPRLHLSFTRTDTRIKPNLFIHPIKLIDAQHKVSHITWFDQELLVLISPQQAQVISVHQLNTNQPMNSLKKENVDAT